MLKTRIITAFLLLIVFLLALFYLPPTAWVAFATLVSAVAAWEWGGLMHLESRARLSVGLAFALICSAVAFAAPSALGLASGFDEAAWRFGRWFYLPAAAFWLIVAPLWMKSRWALPKSPAGLAIGALLLLPTWLALVQLRQAGPLALLALLAMIWLADIAAYFSGRAFGKNKLAPNISPGKTWEGAIGGGVAVLALGLWLATTSGTMLSKSATNFVLLALVLIVLTAISIVGDLFESLLKRQAGLKDSSSVLPGHGGVLDRIDSQISTLPLVALVWLITRY